jgi:hypothetical protein
MNIKATNMKNSLTLLIVLLLATLATLHAAGLHVFEITTFGATGDGRKVNPSAIQKAIDPSYAGEPIVFHVSPNGNDRASGTNASPFATLERARDAVRKELRKKGSAHSIIVELAAGVYHLKRTFVLRPEDSGTPERPITYRSANKASVVISAAEPLVNWKRVKDGIKGTPAASAGSLWEAPLPPGILFTRTLFDSTGLLERATLGPIAAKSEGSENRQFNVNPADLPAWEDLTGIELSMAPTSPYIWNVLGVASIDLSAGRVTTSAPGTVGLTGDAFFENVPEGLNGPGTWWLDSKMHRIVLWPRNQGEPDGILAARMVEAIRLQGTATAPVQHITFQGLTFSHGDRGVKPEQTVQMIPVHDWEYYDQDNASLRLRGTANILVEDCIFTASGGSGLRMDFGARNNSVSHNLFFQLGGSAISLVGNLPGDGDVHSHNELGFNNIHHVGRVMRSSPGIIVYQSHHNKIHDNRLHDLPYAAIVLFGNRDVFMKPQTRPLAELLYGGDNIIEYNDVYSIIQQKGDDSRVTLPATPLPAPKGTHRENDGSGIYLSATPPGNIVRRNHIHDVNRRINGGVRTDDQQSDVVVEENLIHDLDGIGVILKHVNHFRHNIVVDCSALVGVRHIGPNVGSTIHGNILVYRKVVGDSKKMKLDGRFTPFFNEYNPVKLDDYDLADNILFAPSDPRMAELVLANVTALGKKPGVVADPMFVDSDHNDFRLKPESPALRMGFPNIDHWGPREAVGPRL